MVHSDWADWATQPREVKRRLGGAGALGESAFAPLSGPVAPGRPGASQGLDALLDAAQGLET